MIAERRQQLAAARDRHLQRVGTLENAQQALLTDLRRTAGKG